MDKVFDLESEESMICKKYRKDIFKKMLIYPFQKKEMYWKKWMKNF